MAKRRRWLRIRRHPGTPRFHFKWDRKEALESFKKRSNDVIYYVKLDCWRQGARVAVERLVND